MYVYKNYMNLSMHTCVFNMFPMLIDFKPKYVHLYVCMWI